MIVNLNLIVFGIDEGYTLYVLLDNQNKIFTRQLLETPSSIDSQIGNIFIDILGFDSRFCTPVLSSIDVLSDNTLGIFYHTTIPVDTFNKEGYKWVKLNETVYTKSNEDNRTQLSMENYKAIKMASGKRTYEDYSGRRRTAPKTSKCF